MLVFVAHAEDTPCAPPAPSAAVDAVGAAQGGTI